MIECRFDLHTHTTCSDGSDSPIKLLDLAKQCGLSGLSITDHDTIAAYTPELFAHAESLGLRLLTGIELSSEWQDQSVHVLGYNIDVHSAELKSFLTQLIIRRDARNAMMIERLKKKGFQIEPEELLAFGDRTIGRPHIAMLLKEKGYVFSIQEAFQKYLGDKCPCFVPSILRQMLLSRSIMQVEELS
jgi:predicted metal-dependent phosphoesterase TrpH